MRLARPIAIAGTLLLLLPAAASSRDAKARPGCRPAGSTTIVANDKTRVFKWHGLVYGCLRRLGHPVALTANDGYGFDRLRFVKPVMAGAYVGWAFYWESSFEGYGWGVRTMNLSNEHLNLAEFDATLNGQPNKAVVGALKLTASGSAAWSWTLNYDDREVREIRKLEQVTSVRKHPIGVLVDSGPELDLTSLTRQGKTISWLNGPDQKSALLH